jgi:hypothetical protein
MSKSEKYFMEAQEERRRNLSQQIGRIKYFHQFFIIGHDDGFGVRSDHFLV